MLKARTRHFALDIERLELLKGESNAHMATMAARQAIADADIDPMSIDLIVMATSTPDYPFPATALFVQEQLGLSDCCVLELRAGCAGMSQAFLIATRLIQSGTSKRALLIGSDLISPFISLFKTEADKVANDYLVSLAMFGDGAGALLLSAGTSGGGVLDCMSKSMGGNLAPGMILRAGGALAPAGSPRHENGHAGKVYDHDFKKVMKHAPQLMKAARQWVSDERGYDLSKVDLFIPPQANGRLISLIAMQLGVPSAKVFSNFERVGNTVSASIYIALDQLNRQSALKPNDLLVLFPAEATKWLYGAIVVRWTKGQR
jgi:3-oxoacyl-[acyl-carrier-protein] synthase-3